MDRGPSELALLQYMQPVHRTCSALNCPGLWSYVGQPFNGCDITSNRFFRGVTESQPLRHSLSQWSCDDLLSVVPESCRLPPGCLKLPITARTASFKCCYRNMEIVFESYLRLSLRLTGWPPSRHRTPMSGLFAGKIDVSALSLLDILGRNVLFYS